MEESRHARLDSESEVTWERHTGRKWPLQGAREEDAAGRWRQRRDRATGEEGTKGRIITGVGEG